MRPASLRTLDIPLTWGDVADERMYTLKSPTGKYAPTAEQPQRMSAPKKFGGRKAGGKRGGGFKPRWKGRKK